MRLLKWGSFPVASLVLVVLLLGCRPERLQTKVANPRTMAFAQAGVSLVIGEEWECRNAGAERSPFPPTLASQAGVIRVLLLPPDRSEPEIIANGLRADFDANPRVAKHSFRKQQFVSDSGARGLCVSYLQQDQKDPGAMIETQHYLVKNRAGRCVAINFLASAKAADTDAVQRMLRTSLTLQ